MTTRPDSLAQARACWPGARCATAGCARRARLRLPDLVPAAADARAARAARSGAGAQPPGWVSFHDRDHGDGGADALAWGRSAAAGARASDDADGEIWLQTYPRVLGYVFKPVSFWYCHRADGSAGGHRGRGEQHLRRAPLLPALRADLAFGRELVATQGLPRLALLPRRGATASASCARRPAPRGPHRPRRRHGRCCRPASAGTSQPLTAAALRRAFFGMPLMTLGVRRAHPLAGPAALAQARALHPQARAARAPSSHVESPPMP
jgi:hypothetical protein